MPPGSTAARHGRSGAAKQRAADGLDRPRRSATWPPVRSLPSRRHRQFQACSGVALRHLVIALLLPVQP
eukprot:704662-Alexandrium_andersonii.AAC.1